MRRLGVLMALFALCLAGCGDDEVPRAAKPTLGTDELAQHRGPCPGRLPAADRPDPYGFGTDEPASMSPRFLRPTSAWVCTYAARGRQGSAGGTFYTWVRTGRPAAVAPADIPRIGTALDVLRPADEERGCTADLGPRRLLVIATRGDLTGISVDGYGCRDIRLTDDPWATAPGDATGNGVVRGVLSGSSLARWVSSQKG